MSTLYMGASEETVAKYVLFSGDPWRVEVVKKYLDNPKKVAFMREFNTYTGTYKGVEITVTSTGIGAPSAAIAMEEMYESGMQVAVRMGTVMSMQDDMLGHFMIPIAAMRREGTSQSYVDLSYPAVADVELVNVMNETVQQMGKRYLNGLNCTMDGFYSCMHDSKFSLECGRDMSKTFEEVKKLGVTGIDMESSCILTLGRLMGSKVCPLWGQTYITDYIGNVKYQISPLSFYQVNPVQTEVLYGTALEYAGLTGKETVWDVYCGIGTISLFLAQKAQKVYGVEIVPQAIEDAKHNAKINEITNAEFFVGKAEEVLPEYYADYAKEHPGEHARADVIVVDPPRKGCERSVLDTMVQMEPERIVYVSCDSATLARDVKYLRENGYEIRKVKATDMFPMSVHVETCVLLQRRTM